MDVGGWAGSDGQADAFFAQFVDGSPEVVAAVLAEGRGDLSGVVREDREYGYWARVVEKRAARRAARQRAVAAERMRQIAAATRLAHPDERARLAPLPAESAVLLPARRVARVSGEERADTAGWWAGLRVAERRQVLANRMRREVRDGPIEQRRTIVRARSAAERWWLEQRAFERQQWQAVLAVQADRRRKRITNQWIVLNEQRAYEIALAALDKASPPQAGK